MTKSDWTLGDPETPYRLGVENALGEKKLPGFVANPSLILKKSDLNTAAGHIPAVVIWGWFITAAAVAMTMLVSINVVVVNMAFSSSSSVANCCSDGGRVRNCAEAAIEKSSASSKEIACWPLAARSWSYEETMSFDWKMEITINWLNVNAYLTHSIKISVHSISLSKVWIEDCWFEINTY